MGEKIKTLAKARFAKFDLEIELNHPPVNGADKQVHIQTEKFRLEIDKSDYVEYAIAVLLAEKNLKKLKNIE